MKTRTGQENAGGVRVWRSRLLWLVGIWTASVLATVTCVEILRLAMEAAGLKTH
jgi:hypothetical protein